MLVFVHLVNLAIVSLFCSYFSGLAEQVENLKTNKTGLFLLRKNKDGGVEAFFYIILLIFTKKVCFENLYLVC